MPTSCSHFSCRPRTRWPRERRDLRSIGADGSRGAAARSRRRASGYGVRRNSARLAAVTEGLTVVTGELSDQDAVARAVRGQDAVISTLGVSKALRPDLAVVNGIAQIIDAMQSSAVLRLVYLSFVGVRDSRPYAGGITRHIAARVLRNEIVDHERKEHLIRQSTLEWTIVRAPKLKGGPPTGAYRSGEQIAAGTPLSTLARADVAQFMLGQLTDNAFLDKAPSLFASRNLRH
ncbi:MAG: NAD(P)-dependent oxidoreductase [Solirubrobacteraceae bacterium]